MQRRRFIESILALTGGLVSAGYLPANAAQKNERGIKGRVISNRKGVKGVVVSDGYSVIMTDDNGKYNFDLHPNARAIFISTPAGYAFKNQNGIARHYRQLKEINLKKSLVFDLVPLGQDDSEHQFIIWADPQVKNEKDVQKMMDESVPDVQKLVAAAGTSALLHGITVGDIVWDELKLFADYDKAVGKMGIPFFQCLGNHDMDYRQGGDETSDQTFQQTYGPTYYSFNRGQVHYVVMDNVRYLGKEREYDGFLVQHQLDWLKKDLGFVPKDKLVVLCVHIPVHSGTKNKEDLYALLQGRSVHIMSGHTHIHKNVITDNIYEHNHGTVCGAWWTGPICEDGTPNGYGVYKVKGTTLQWQYKSTGKDADHQMKTFVNNIDNDTKQVQVNIWNYDPAWKTKYFVDGVEKGELLQFEGMDPLAYSTLLGPELPKPRGFAEPKKTNHLFKATVPATAKSVTIKATDRFGTTYTATHNI
jgi:C terminal of Calcineurin-like phosphoesterase/N terminal of Calcineurin-like phosphoesterase/Calcineurin-like phosphoesterase